MNWVEVCSDKKLEDLPYKIELNKAGQIVMSPTRNRHGYFAGKITRLLGTIMSQGEVLVELAIDTADGVKVADVAWVSPETFALIKDEPSCSVAPEICVEVQSPHNTAEELQAKCGFYLGAGAKECWICKDNGQMEFLDATGQLSLSKLCPSFPLQLPV